MKFLLLSLNLLLITACSNMVPVQEMSDARQAIQAANQVGANYHAQHQMLKAQEYLSQAEHHLYQGLYHDAKDQALAAKQQALKARNLTLSMENTQ